MVAAVRRIVVSTAEQEREKGAHRLTRPRKGGDAAVAEPRVRCLGARPRRTRVSSVSQQRRTRRMIASSTESASS
jgi:hypothetical protein